MAKHDEKSPNPKTDEPGSIHRYRENEHVPESGGHDRSLQSEANPGADRDRDTATSGTTRGGQAGEIADLEGAGERADRDRSS